MNKIIFLISFSSFLLSQNVDLYFSLINEGELDGVKENLPELLSKYPNDPGVLYLKAVLTDDGESALKQYKYILENFSKEVENFKQICPIEMLDKLEHPISLDPKIKEVS